MTRQQRDPPEVEAVEHGELIAMEAAVVEVAEAGRVRAEVVMVRLGMAGDVMEGEAEVLSRAVTREVRLAGQEMAVTEALPSDTGGGGGAQSNRALG